MANPVNSYRTILTRSLRIASYTYVYVGNFIKILGPRRPESFRFFLDHCPPTAPILRHRANLTARFNTTYNGARKRRAEPRQKRRAYIRREEANLTRVKRRRKVRKITFKTRSRDLESPRPSGMDAIRSGHEARKHLASPRQSAVMIISDNRKTLSYEYRLRLIR